MQVAASVLGSARHESSEACRLGHAQKVQHERAKLGAKALERRFTAYGTEELRQVELFRYLGRVTSHVDNDVPAMRRNLKRARGQWKRISVILAKEEIPAPVAGMFYQAVVGAVLLYGSESWNLPPSAKRTLEGFHVEAARRLTGMRPVKRGGTWVYPKSEEVLKAARLRTIEEYIAARRQRAAALMVGRPVLEMCRNAERMRGSAPRQMWWDQAIDWDLAEEAAAARAAKVAGCPAPGSEIAADVEAATEAPLTAPRIGPANWDSPPRHQIRAWNRRAIDSPPRDVIRTWAPEVVPETRVRSVTPGVDHVPTVRQDPRSRYMDAPE